MVSKLSCSFYFKTILNLLIAFKTSGHILWPYVLGCV